MANLFFMDSDDLIDIYLDVLRDSQPSGELPTVQFKNDWFEFRYTKTGPSVAFRVRKADFVTMINGICNNANIELELAD